MNHMQSEVKRDISKVIADQQESSKQQSETDGSLHASSSPRSTGPRELSLRPGECPPREVQRHNSARRWTGLSPY